MTRDLIEQIIKEKEIALNDVPSDLKDNIILFLKGYLDKWQSLDLNNKLMEIDAKRMKYSGWHLRLTDKREDIGQEKIIPTLNRYNFFLYPNLTPKVQFDIWILVLKICLTFLDKIGMQEIFTVNKELIDKKIIRFQPPKQDGFYYFIDSNNAKFYSFEPISFWLNKTDYSNIREGILLHLKVILEEKAKSWFENIEENILETTSNEEQAVNDFNEKLADDIKPLIKNFPIAYLKQFETFDTLAPNQILPFLSLESIRYYQKNQGKNYINGVKKKMAQYVYNSIMDKNAHPKDFFDKVRAFYVKRMINKSIDKITNNTPSIEPTTKAWALYHYYLQLGGYREWFEYKKWDSIKKVCIEKYDNVSPKNFQLQYNKLGKKSHRIIKANLPIIKQVTGLLKEYPKSLELAIKDKETIEKT